jgi:signal transduction histidine kinase
MGRVTSVFARGVSRSSVLRARRFTFFFLVFALILLALNVVGWRVQASTRRALEAELGERLRAIAIAAAQPVDPDYVDEIRTGPGGSLSELVVLDHFRRLEQALDVANIVLLDPTGRTLVDLSGSVETGEVHPVVRLHAGAFALASSGSGSTSELYRSNGVFYKNGYAPVKDVGGDVLAVVAVESGARYFETLKRLAGAITLANAASGIVVVVLGAFLFHVLRTQARLDETLRRTESLTLMGELAASVAHEVKNPLGIIRATAETIKKRHGTGDELFDYIPEEVDRLTGIVNTYLDFARGGTPAAGGVSNVHEAVDSVLQLTRRDLGAASVSVEAPIDEALVARVEPTALRQVLLNLVVNAAQAMPHGGVLRIAAAREGRQVVIEVSDTGVGIAPQDLKRVFRPFYSGREKGSGLGLAIAHRVVTDAGGEIRVESERGVGTTFTLTFPGGPSEAEA